MSTREWPEQLSITLTFDRLGEKMPPLQQEWVSAELPDGSTASFTVGAGLGNSGMTFRAGGEIWIASLSPAFGELVSQIAPT